MEDGRGISASCGSFWLVTALFPEEQRAFSAPMRQQVLKPAWGPCQGFALLFLLLFLQLFWGFISPIARFTAWRIILFFC